VKPRVPNRADGANEAADKAKNKADQKAGRKAVTKSSHFVFILAFNKKLLLIFNGES